MFVLGNTYVCPGIWDIWKCIKSEIVKSVLRNTYICSGKYLCLSREIHMFVLGKSRNENLLRVLAIALFFALFCKINSGP